MKELWKCKKLLKLGKEENACVLSRKMMRWFDACTNTTYRKVNDKNFRISHIFPECKPSILREAGLYRFLGLDPFRL